tara:strand:+ start:9014 stop:10372 length:1359 start_codon:yes stop_codon:yes gene_type:complete
MKTNILFLIIDSFRNDKFFGNDRTCKTPNIDNLVKNGTYFQQAVSTSDATILNWTSIFSGLIPPKTGIRSEKFNKLNENVKTIFNILEEHDYNFYSYLTNISDTLGLFPKFMNDDYHELSEPRLTEGVGQKIIDNVNSNKLKAPWFFLAHTMDLHFPIMLHNDYNSSKYGENTYEKQISSLDFWLGKISKTIDTKNTILIISADHGTYINSVNLDGNIVSTEENYSNEMIKRKIGFKIPKFLDPVKKRAFFLNEKKSQENKIKKIKNLNLKPHEIRNLLSGKFEIDQTLFDEKVRIPLLFYGKGITSNKIINQQVRNVDILPTLLDFLNIPTSSKLDGISLKPLMENGSLEELPAYIESTPLIQIQSNNVLGIRTSKYKYFRDSINPKKRIHLYDLGLDPHEENNIHETNPGVIEKMEQLISSFNNTDQSIDEFSQEETDMIEDELRKMGYV